ncbi:tetratricopeptide repeat protein [Geothermobacter ehrlichii]|uniref:Tetratricopeptide repeat protein n=1 Tax=Geothermobacter ehrlichii TaxID=213224 RepID=A0A5D3WKJ7_9BACT|nr:tetratricopeptide repeat protein [Geothermobacter ehrlichii]TYO96823.1 tetratricopeptide repeat protein [Geothermobacter ehrlichii]
MPRLLLYTLLLSLCLARPVFAATADDQLGFADRLFSEEDYYRAVTEYKRFLYHFPDHPEAPGALLRMARAYLAGERFEEADRTLEQLAASFPDSPEAVRGALLYAEAAFRRHDYLRARQRYRQAARTYPRLRQQADYRIAWCLIEEEKYADARQLLAPLPGTQATALAAGIDRLQSLPLKSPATAGVLSALLPGAGQVYTGRYRDGAIALALNAAFIFAAVEAFDNDSPVLGGILTFIELGWYGGNIYNAVNNAHKGNRRRLEEERTSLRRRYGLDLEAGPNLGMIRLRWRF